MGDTEKQLAGLVPLASQGDSRALRKVIKIIYPMVLRYARARISGGVIQRLKTSPKKSALLLLPRSINLWTGDDRSWRSFMV